MMMTANTALQSFNTNKLIKDTNDAWKLHKAQLGRRTEDGAREEEEEKPKPSSE